MKVRLGVFVIGWKSVGEGLGVQVDVDVGVGVGVLVAVGVSTGGVRLMVGIRDTLVGVGMFNVTVAVGVGVAGFESGASTKASHPVQ